MTRTGRAALSLLPGTLLALGAVLIGWGLDDLGGFFSNRARVGLIAAVSASYVLGTLLGIEFNPLRKGKQIGRAWPIFAGMSIVPIIYGVLSFCDRRGIFVFPDLAAIRWAGVIAYAIGEGIRLAALHALGRQYSALLTIQPGHQLIRSGPYRLVRHPFYLGQLLAVPGLMLTLRSPIALIVFGASVIFVVGRIRREEQVLVEEFSDEYREYQRHSWRLMPYVF